MVYFAFGVLTLLGVWTVLLWKDEMKKLDEKYTDTRPSFHGSLIEPIKENKSKETNPENKEKQKIKIT